MTPRAVNHFTFICNGKHSELSYIIYKGMRCKQESMHVYQSMRDIGICEGFSKYLC